MHYTKLCIQICQYFSENIVCMSRKNAVDALLNGELINEINERNLEEQLTQTDKSSR